MKFTTMRFFLVACAIGQAALLGQAARGATIAATKLAADNTVVTIDNVVISNTIDLVNSASVASFQVQDATGGVTVFGSNAVIAAALTGVNAGDIVTITGTTDSFNGFYELIAPLTVTLVTDEAGIPAPTAATVAELQNLSPVAEALESKLIKLSNVTFTGLAPGQTFAGLTNYTVTDGLLNATVRVNTTALSMVGDLIPTGPVNITGILQQFDSTNPAPGVPGASYQLYLLDDSSVVPVPEPGSIFLVTFALAGLAGSCARRRGC